MAAVLAADLVMIAHGAFVMFAVLGGLLVFRSWRWAWLHVPAFVWAGFIELTGGICPLTPLENWLRVSGGCPAYGEGFIEHTLLSFLYPEDLTRDIQIYMGFFVLLLNALIYLAAWRWSRQANRPV